MEGKTKLQPVVSAPVTKRKKTGFQKIAGIVSDNLEKNDVKGRIINDIILPMILDTVNTGLSGMFGIEPTKSRQTLNSIVSTARSSEYWKAGNKPSVVSTARATRTVYDFDNPVYSTLSDAETVLRNLMACVEQYNQISVSDILELSGTIPSSTDYKYGWTDIGNVDIVHVAEGYMIRLPRPVPLD